MEKITKEIILFFLAGLAIGFMWGYTSCVGMVAENVVKFLDLNMSRGEVIYSIMRLH